MIHAHSYPLIHASRAVEIPYHLCLLNHANRTLKDLLPSPYNFSTMKKFPKGTD